MRCLNFKKLTILTVKMAWPMLLTRCKEKTNQSTILSVCLSLALSICVSPHFSLSLSVFLTHTNNNPSHNREKPN